MWRQQKRPSKGQRKDIKKDSLISVLDASTQMTHAMLEKKKKSKAAQAVQRSEDERLSEEQMLSNLDPSGAIRYDAMSSDCDNSVFAVSFRVQ